jgi:hypothetical protein
MNQKPCNMGLGELVRTPLNPTEWHGMQCGEQGHPLERITLQEIRRDSSSWSVLNLFKPDYSSKAATRTTALVTIHNQ